MNIIASLLLLASSYSTYYSDNWAGYLQYGTYQSISGWVTVPKLPPHTNCESDYRLEVWEGFGAKYNVAQAGIGATSCTSRSHQRGYRVWVENFPDNSYDLGYPNLKYGQHVYIRLALALKNELKYTIKTIVRTYQGSFKLKYWPGKTREWIIEPHKPYSFGTVQFSGVQSPAEQNIVLRHDFSIVPSQLKNGKFSAKG